MAQGAKKVQRYGRQRQHPGNLPDNHPQRGRVNWWEAEFHDGNKKRARQQARREVEEGVAMAEDRSELTDHLKIEVFQQDWIPGFAAFMDGSVDHEGHAHVVLNLGALMAAVAEKDIEPADIPYIVAEVLMHEVVHALEEWAGVEFSEKRVEELIQRYQERYKGAAPIEGPDPADLFERAFKEVDEAVEAMPEEVTAIYLSHAEKAAFALREKWRTLKSMMGRGDSGDEG